MLFTFLMIKGRGEEGKVLLSPLSGQSLSVTFFEKWFQWVRKAFSTVSMYSLPGFAIQCVSQEFRFHSALEQSVFLRQTAAWGLHWNATLHSPTDMRKLDECQWNVDLMEVWWSLLGEREKGHFLEAGNVWCSHSAPETANYGNQQLFGSPWPDAHLTGRDNIFCKPGNKNCHIFKTPLLSLRPDKDFRPLLWKMLFSDRGDNILFHALKHLLFLISSILVFPMLMSQDLFLPEWISLPILVILAWLCIK